MRWAQPVNLRNYISRLDARQLANKYFKSLKEW